MDWEYIQENLGYGGNNPRAKELIDSIKDKVITDKGFMSTTKDYDIADEYMILATLDRKICDICGDQDTKHYKIKDAKVGVNMPPFHPNCRCTTVVYFGDEEDMPEERMMRDENGKSVKTEYMSYDEWKKKYVDKVDDNGYNIIEKSIKDGLIKDKINIEKQSRHLLNSHIEGRSYLKGDIDFAEDICYEFRGKGEPIMSNGSWTNKERVDTRRIVAVYIDSQGNEIDTTNIIIVYSNTGSHILGGRPNEA